MNLEPERLAGRWVVAGELGRGGMGRVVLVRDSCAEGVPLAAKVLERSELRADFLQEVELLRSLAHPLFPAAREPREVRLATHSRAGATYATRAHRDRLPLRAP